MPDLVTHPALVEYWVPGGNFGEGTWVPLDQRLCSCTEITHTVHPAAGGLSRATVVYDWGNVDYRSFGFEYLEPFDWNRKWVRISLGGLFPVVQFVGIAVAVEDRDRVMRSGFINEGGTPRGTQLVEVVGPEWLLTRQQVATDTIAYTDIEVDIIPGFNLPVGTGVSQTLEQTPNKHDTESYFGFGQPDYESVLWTGKDAVEYLFYTHYPKGFPPTVWKFANGDPALIGSELLEWMHPVMPIEGYTVYELFSEIAKPSRGLLWWMYYERDDGNPNSRFGRFVTRFGVASSDPIVLPSGKAIPGSELRKSINPSMLAEARMTRVDDSQPRYNQVVVTGAHEGFCLTTRDNTGDTTNEAWSPTEETEYKKSAEDIFPDLTDIDQQNEAMDQWRSSTSPNVYTTFNASSLDVLDAIGTYPDSEVDKFQIVFHMLNFMRFGDSLPLRRNWDYSSSTPEPKASATTGEPYLEPFAIYKVEGQTYEGTGDPVYKRHDELSDLNQSDQYLRNDFFNASLQMRKDEMGYYLVPSGAPAHLQAGKSENIKSTDRQPLVDWKDVRVTVYLPMHKRVKGVWPDKPTAPYDGYQQQILHIQLGDVAFYDRLMPKTVVAVEGGKLIESPDSEVVVRDDRDYLKDVARMAWKWYGKERQAFQLSFQSMGGLIPEPGDVITFIDAEETDVLVTSVTWTVGGGTTIQTNYTVPDFLELSRN